MNQNPEKIDVLSKIIRERRSVYPNMFTGEIVSDEKIRVLLQNANWAPNHKMTEPWRFHVFSGEKLKSISNYLGRWYKNNTPVDQFSEAKYLKTIQKPLAASHVIVICMYRDMNEIVPEWEEIAAVACAVQNMWLSCSAMGLGGYWSTPKAILKARDFLGLRANEKCLGMMYIGVPKNPANSPGKRKAYEEKITWNV